MRVEEGMSVRHAFEKAVDVPEHSLVRLERPSEGLFQKGYHQSSHTRDTKPAVHYTLTAQIPSQNECGAIYDSRSRET